MPLKRTKSRYGAGNTMRVYRSRGRPTIDRGWSELVAGSNVVVENSFDENQELLIQYREGSIPVGCRLQNSSDVDAGTKWQVFFYLAGKQRLLAKGTLYQCAKFYDYALLFFTKYRVKKEFSQFNFNKEDAESDMAVEPAIRSYLEALEKYLLECGALISPEEKKDRRYFKQRDAQRTWRHKQSASYQILSAIAVLRADVLELRELLETKNLTDS